MERRAIRAYRYLITNWNAILAAISVAGVAIFGLIPALNTYVIPFVFIGANAIVWTLIEIKVALRPKPSDSHAYSNMRMARPHIVREIDSRLARTTPDRPLEVTLLGGRIRSMSDVLREVYDDLRTQRVSGHISVQLHCVDPGYISSRRLPGALSTTEQEDRQLHYSSVVRSTAAELRGMRGTPSHRSSVDVEVTFYTEDPHVYAYLIGDSVIYWGTYLWSAERSDFLGPENPCYRLDHTHPWFPSIRDWLRSRTELYEAEHHARVHPSATPAT